MRCYLLVLLAACSVGEEGPAAPGSASAALASQAGDLGKQAAEIEDLSHQLEVQVDEGRRRMAAGDTTQEQEVATERDLMAQIDAKNTAFQKAAADWEATVVKKSGNTTVPAFTSAPAAPPALSPTPTAPSSGPPITIEAPKAPGSP